MNQRPRPATLRSTLDEASQNDLVEVTEIDEGGRVPTMKVSNKADRPLFLMSGEQLQGAKQNRVLNISIMVASHSDLPIPVSCVEAGGWRNLKVPAICLTKA